MKPAAINSPRTCRGLTLYDLLLSLAVAAVALFVAAPNVSSVIAQNRLAANINTLVGALNLARAEAVARGEDVVVCRSINAGTTTPGCNTGTSNWSAGWLVFENTDNDSPPVRDSGEPVLQVFVGMDAGYLLDSSAAFDNAISFNATGDVGSGGEFVLCKDNDTFFSRSITIDRTGNVNQASRSSDGVLTRRDGTTVGSCTAP